MKAEDFGYVVKNNLCLFQKGCLSQWWGGFKGQDSSFKVKTSSLYGYYTGENSKLIGIIEREYNHLYFNCCEQWMMACKAILFDDADTFRLIMDTKSPSRQKDLGRVISNYEQEVWEIYKYQIVLQGNKYKFEQNPELKEFLMGFNYFTIFAEAASYDKIWGTGLDITDERCLDINNWTGQNLLGRAITDIRRSYIDL
jgi:ribA/ribD-fused uncharacterized protein